MDLPSWPGRWLVWPGKVHSANAEGDIASARVLSPPHRCSLPYSVVWAVPLVLPRFRWQLALKEVWQLLGLWLERLLLRLLSLLRLSLLRLSLLRLSYLGGWRFPGYYLDLLNNFSFII